MYSSRLVYWLMGLSMVAIGQSTPSEEHAMEERAVERLALEERQILSSIISAITDTATRATTTAAVTTTTSNPPTQPTTSASPSPTTTNSPSNPQTTTPAPSTTNPQTTSKPSTDPTSSDNSPSVVTKTTFATYETTDSNGQKSTATGETVVTETAGLNGSGDGQQGMSTETRNTIIGVCVGVGGAIVLAAVGILVWRLRSKRRQQDDHDDLAGTSQFNHGPEKASDHSGSFSGRTPFQSTLESYHAPTQTNAASNF